VHEFLQEFGKLGSTTTRREATRELSENARRLLADPIRLQRQAAIALSASTSMMLGPDTLFRYSVSATVATTTRGED